MWTKKRSWKYSRQHHLWWPKTYKTQVSTSLAFLCANIGFLNPLSVPMAPRWLGSWGCQRDQESGAMDPRYGWGYRDWGKDTAAPGDAKGVGQGSLQGVARPVQSPNRHRRWGQGTPNGECVQLRGRHSLSVGASGTPRGVGTPKASELGLGVKYWAPRLVAGHCQPPKGSGREEVLASRKWVNWGRWSPVSEFVNDVSKGGWKDAQSDTSPLNSKELVSLQEAQHKYVMYYLPLVVPLNPGVQQRIEKHNGSARRPESSQGRNYGILPV